MPNLSALSRGTQVLAAAGLLLLIFTFLPWQDFAEGVGGDIAESLGVDATWNAWHGFWGVLMGLMVVVLLAWVIARIMEVQLPFEFPDGLVTLALGALIFLFALIKNLTDDYSTIWSYIGVLLAAAVAYGAWLRYQEAGGTVESLKAAIPRQAPSSSSGGAGGTTMDREPDVTPTAAPPEAPRPAEPAPPSSRTTEPMTQTGPTPSGGASAPSGPTEPSAPSGPDAPRTEPADETEGERPPQPPPSPSGPS